MKLYTICIPATASFLTSYFETAVLFYTTSSAWHLELSEFDGVFRERSALSSTSKERFAEFRHHYKLSETHSKQSATSYILRNPYIFPSYSK